MAVTITIKDRTTDVKALMAQKARQCLEMMGLQAETYAKLKCPVGSPESTHIAGYHGGTLRNSITHAISNDTAIVGTNVEYGKYVELGTGIYASSGNGRQTPWLWQDQNGKWHRTVGMKPRHFLKSAIVDHKQDYKRMAEKILKN